MAPQNPLVSRIATRLSRLVAGADDIVIADLSAGNVDLHGTTSADNTNTRAGAARDTLSDLFSDQGRDRLGRYADYREMAREVPELKTSAKVKQSFVFGGGSESGQTQHGGMEVIIDAGATDQERALLEDTQKAVNVPRLLKAKFAEGMRLGDSCTELVWNDKRLVWTKPLLPERFEVRWDVWGRLQTYRIFRGDGVASGSVDLQPFQMLHFAYDRQRGHKYGTSNWETARRVWRAFDNVEDILSILTQLKAAGRKSVAYPVPDTTTPEQLPTWMAQLKSGNARPQFFESDGKLRRRLAALLELDDLIYPYRQSAKPPVFHNEQPPDISPLLSALQLFQERYFVATGVPAALCGVERNVNARATLEQQGLHFVSTCRDEQQDVADHAVYLHYLALMVAGMPPRPGLITVRMPRVSAFDDQLRAQVMKLRAEAAKILGIDVGLPMRWVLQSVLAVPEEEADLLLEEWGVPLSSNDGDPTQTAASTEAAINKALRGNAALAEMVARLKEDFSRLGARVVATNDPAWRERVQLQPGT